MDNIFNMADEDEERRRFSPDSSTQVLVKEKRKHSKKKKHKHKSKKRKQKHSEEKASDHDGQHSDSTSNSTAPSDDEKPKQQRKNEVEFVIDIKPLTEYIDDRKKLNNELFKILGRKEMKKLMPKSVKKLDVDELKSRCLDQLEVISKKRLLRIMEGQEMNSSSSESEHEAGDGLSSMDIVEEIPAVEGSQPVPNTREDQTVNIMEELSVGPDQDEIDELIEGPGEKSESEDEEADQDSPENDSPVKADTASQLLELEYRARALKSLMHARQSLDS